MWLVVEWDKKRAPQPMCLDTKEVEYLASITEQGHSFTVLCILSNVAGVLRGQAERKD